MPKAFEDAERDQIRTRLMAVGFEHFDRLGIRAARVDDICREVGIAKGSFYAFFPSKEELFMSIVEQREAVHMTDMLAFLQRPQGKPATRAGRFFDMIRDKLETDPVFNLVLANDELAYLTRKLGIERFAAGEARDRAFASDAARQWGLAEGRRIDPADLIGLMTIALCIAMQRRQMSDSQYQPTVALMRRLFIDRMGAGAR